MQDRGNNVSRMYHAKRKWRKVKSCSGYQLLPLQSANNAVISIKRMQTHLVVDCCQEQVDVLSRNVTTSPRLAPTRTPEGECPRNPYGKWKTCPEGVRLQLGSVSGLRPRYSPPRVDLTHALLSLSRTTPSRTWLMMKSNWKLNEAWFGLHESSAGSLGVVGWGVCGRIETPRLWQTEPS